MIKMYEESFIKRLFKRREEKKSFSVILIISRLLVFFTFIYAAAIMFKLEKAIEGSIILFAIAIWLILYKLEGS